MKTLHKHISVPPGFSFAFLCEWIGRTTLLILLAGLLGTAANGWLPQRIAWFKDWAHHIEAQAYREQFFIASASTVRQIIREGSHILLDSRPYQDYQAGHIETALPLSPHDTDDPYGTRAILTPDDALLIYCGESTCDLSLVLGRQLRDAGHTNITIFVGGYEAWTRLLEDNS